MCVRFWGGDDGGGRDAEGHGDDGGGDGQDGEVDGEVALIELLRKHEEEARQGLEQEDHAEVARHAGMGARLDVLRLHYDREEEQRLQEDEVQRDVEGRGEIDGHGAFAFLGLAGAASWKRFVEGVAGELGDDVE